MFEAKYKAAAGIMIENQRQDLVAHNLAGSELPGYRRQFLVASLFEKKLDQQLGEIGNSSGGANSLSGTSSGRTYTDFAPGVLKQTGRVLDFALQGPGFFAVENGNGDTLYTRNGAFVTTSDGQLVTREGLQVSSTGGSLKFRPDDAIGRLQVDSDGSLYIRNGEEVREIGRLKIVEIKPEDLERVSASYFRATSPASTDDETELEGTEVSNRILEQSNVSPLIEMATMITSFRRYESAYKTMQMIEESMREHGQAVT